MLLASPALAAPTASDAAGGRNASTVAASAPLLTAVSAATLPANFTDTIALGGLTYPMSVRFANDGRVFVAQKSGRILVYSGLSDVTPTLFADLSTNVHDFWDRGLMSIALAPNFPTDPYVYVLYAYDAAIGGVAPLWPDSCPANPGATTDGCVISGRLSRLQALGDVMTGTEQVLINDWCQQFPSHSLGDLRFGADGMLYISAGEGASFNNADYGQFGGTVGNPPATPKNPCGDPPAGVGGTMTPPTARGGALRSQSLRRPAGEPRVLNGTVLRVDPSTGAGLADNPLGGSANANENRMIGYGFRNPFRFTIRPGTNDVWIGDVGSVTWEEIDQLTFASGMPIKNFGWPCYEGAGRYADFDVLNLTICEDLYASSGAVTSPVLSYDHAATVVPGESCPTGSSAIAGMTFYGTGSYPSSYTNALFFADHSRNCIWVMRAGTGGLPDPSQVATFVSAASNPVDLEIGPGGDLFYVDFEGGAIHRITYGANRYPIAVISAAPTSGPPPLVVSFSGASSSDPDPGDTLTYSWDLNGDGTFGDSTAANPTYTYTTNGSYIAQLRVTDPGGLSDTATVTINVNNAAPTPLIDSPAAGTQWKVGDPIAFSGHATDPQDGIIPPSKLDWTVVLHHCPSNCHTHIVQTFSAVASGTFAAPDHDYPSYLELILTATDSSGLTSTASLRLDPQTVGLTFQTNPTGLIVSVADYGSTSTPFTRTVIIGSANTVTATSPQILSGTNYAFGSWSDGGAGTHTITAPAFPATYVAVFSASDTTSYLSDLAWTQVANGWGPVEKDRSNGENLAGDGAPLTLNGVTYAKGLGTHAASEVDYAMAGACSLFTASVGVDDEISSVEASLVFQVWGDTTKLYDSGTMGAATATKALSVDVAGRTTLRLVVTDGGDGNFYDHGDWANAQLTCGGGAPPPDTTPPTVTTTSPATGATGVAVAANITATFSEAMTASSISTSSVTLVVQGTTPLLAASVNYDPVSLTVTLHPSASLAAATTYLATVKGGASGVKDAAGNALALDKTWTFTTAAAADTTPPTVTTTSPATGATGVAVAANITATFSEAMTASSISTSSVTLVVQGTTPLLAASVNYDPVSLTVTLHPSASLAAATTYLATVKGGASGVKDAAGNALALDKTWTFTTRKRGGR